MSVISGHHSVLNVLSFTFSLVSKILIFERTFLSIAAQYSNGVYRTGNAQQFRFENAWL